LFITEEIAKMVSHSFATMEVEVQERLNNRMLVCFGIKLLMTIQKIINSCKRKKNQTMIQFLDKEKKIEANKIRV